MKILRNAPGMPGFSSIEFSPSNWFHFSAVSDNDDGLRLKAVLAYADAYAGCGSKNDFCNHLHQLAKCPIE